MSPYTVTIIYSLFVIFLCSVVWLISRKKDGEELLMYGESKIIIWVLSIFFVVVSFFFALKDFGYEIPDGIGQVGDFIGGLTNPILSFAGLVVLLRSTLIQTRSAETANKYLREQQSLFRYEQFQTEFYSLLKYLDDYAERNIRKDNYVESLLELHARSNERLSGLSGDELTKAARDLVVGSIEHTKFERFALSVRRAIKHIHTAKMTVGRKFEFMDMLMDSLTLSERIVLLNWAYFYWPEAKKWMAIYRLSRGIKLEDFIIDEIAAFFSGDGK